MMTWLQLDFQDAASPMMEELTSFHDFTMVIIIFIISVVGLALVGMVSAPFIDQSLLEGQLVECVWTLVPAGILTCITFPSLLLMYMLDESAHNSLTVKATGHQWYWSYEMADYWGGKRALEFDSYMIKSGGDIRLLEVDSRMVLPYSAHIRVLITAADVLHSWALPALGVKADACPGRLNQVKLLSHRPGIFFGQCSEICGANHSFMPIGVEFVSSKDYVSWVKRALMY